MTNEQIIILSHHITEWDAAGIVFDLINIVWC
jgi:hypothetical protein